MTKTVFTLFGNSFYFSNRTFISQTVTNTTKPIRSSLLYEYNNSFSHNKSFLCYLLCRQIGMDEESKFSICFSPFLSVLSCVCEQYSPLSFVLYCEGRRFVQWRYSWFSFSYDMIFLIHIHIHTEYIEFSNCTIISWSIVCARRIMLETYGLMTPMHTTFTKKIIRLEAKVVCKRTLKCCINLQMEHKRGGRKPLT